MVENMRLSAHRGAHTVAPENTIEAYQQAIDLGYGAIEIDPRFSSDGEIFLMHDDTVDRTTNGTGNLSSLTAAQIKALEIDITDYPEYKGKTLRVPTLDEAIKVIASGDIILNIDGSKVNWSNAAFTKKVVDILKKYGVYEKTYFVISDVAQRKAFNTAYPEAVLSWLHTDANTINTAITTARTYQKAILSIPANIATDAVLTILRNTSIYFQVYGVNTKSDLERLLAKRVPMVETDSLYPL